MGGVLLALLSVGLFVAFVHHVATMLQAENVVAQVGAEMCEAVVRFFPAEPTGGQDEAGRGGDVAGGVEVRAERGGYVQAVNVQNLVALAAEVGACVVCERRPGHYVAEGQVLARVTGGEEIDLGGVRTGFLLGEVRTAEQDFEFTFLQLSEVAMRALSPSLNDPNTAMNCIDRLGSGLRLAAGRHDPPWLFRDGEGEVRVRTWKTCFEDVLGAALDQIRNYARGQVDVSCRILEMLGGVAEASRTDEQRRAVRRQAELVAGGISGCGVSDYDEGAVMERLDEVRAKLDCKMHDKS